VTLRAGATTPRAVARVARRSDPAHNRGVSNWGSYSFLFGPMIALVALAGLALVARWASQTGTSLIERPARQGSAEEYGLMIPVASPVNARDSRDVAARLTAAGVRHREVTTTEGPRVMVWAEDVARARAVLDSPR
jgi:hypothetical protein